MALSSLLRKLSSSQRLLQLALAFLPFTAVAQVKAPAPVDGGTLTYAVSQEPTSLVSFLDTKTDNRNSRRANRAGATADPPCAD